jgi:hypothetical protein
MRWPAPPLIGFRPLSVFPRMRAAAAASFCLSVASSAAAAAVLVAAAVRSTLMTFASLTAPIARSFHLASR